MRFLLATKPDCRERGGLQGPDGICRQDTTLEVREAYEGNPELVWLVHTQQMNNCNVLRPGETD